MIPSIKTVLFVTLLAHCTPAFCSENKVWIKISTRDCVLCNMNLDNVYTHSGNTEKILVLKDEQKEDEEFLETLHLDERKNTTVYFSDSMYYRYDSTERSIFYVIDNASIKFKKYLKEVNVEELALLFAKRTKNTITGIKIPKYAFLTDLDTHFGIIDRSGQCYRVSKDNLSEVYDTIKLITPQIIEDIFKSRYGNEYAERMKKYDEILAMPDVREVPTIISKTFNKNDTLYAVVNTYDAEIKIENSADTIIKIIALMNIVKFKGNRYLGTLVLEEDKEIDNEHYYVLPTMFFVHSDKVYMSVFKPALSDNNPVFTEMKQNGQKLEMISMAPIQLPELNITSKMGYNALGTTNSKKYIAFTNTPYIYNIATFTKYDLPFYLEANQMNKKQMEELTMKMSSYLISMNDEGNELNFIYCSNDSVKHASCTIENDKIKLQKETLLSANYKTKGDFSYIIADKNGYYRYVKEKQAIEYFPY